MIIFLNSHPEYFTEALELAIGSKQPYSWRAAWLLWSCMEENDSRVRAYIPKIIAAIPEKKDGHQRELLKLLHFLDLDDEQEGRVFDLSMTIWESLNKSPSIRGYAFMFILKVVEKYPELQAEFDFITQDQYLETLSPGIKHSIKNKVMKAKSIRKKLP